MDLWLRWMSVVRELRPACSRVRTFLWLSLCLAGMCIRPDLAGVTSIVRAFGLQVTLYDRLLDFFHSPALDIDVLARLWAKTSGGSVSWSYEKKRAAADRRGRLEGAEGGQKDAGC